MTKARIAAGFILAMAVAAATGSPVAAQDAAPAQVPAPAPAPAAKAGAAVPERNWQVNCSGDGEARRCTVLQNLVADQGKGQQRLLTVMVQPGADNLPALLLALPHGLFLPAGVQMQIDKGEAQKLVIQTADQNGSYAGAALDAALLDRLKAGSALDVTFQSAQQQAVTVPVTLVGFSAAYADYTAGRASDPAPAGTASAGTAPGGQAPGGQAPGGKTP
ncbi:invasion associated locus B family protein [Aureimonas sp. SA4125]|uniref:invasion associated locus B family protein n=1 Tax=Aureimonas sp. SA4125 TaxID=2826993 RepID=UPI001CC5D932|nr:invasion associated locus B family protein [Aureimonas sp. SA4125]